MMKIFKKKYTYQVREGEKFTSKTHGFKFSSISMSKPYSSKTNKKSGKVHVNVLLKSLKKTTVHDGFC